jgi:branched-chain amino acid transport system permease protein
VTPLSRVAGEGLGEGRDRMDLATLAFFLLETKFRQVVIIGLVVGSLYALVAIGFVLIYKASQAVNFAQGEMVMLGGYLIVVMVTNYSLPLAVAFPLTLAIGAILGFVIERGILRPLIGKPLISIVMATIGLASVVRGLVATLWTSSTRAVPQLSIGPFHPFSDKTVNILGTPVAQIDLWSLGFAVAFIVGMTAFFKYTRTGIAMQAVADDQQAALSMGISVRRIFAISWAIALVVAAVGGMMWGARQGVDLTLALVGIIVFPAVILGGLESLAGAIVGGIIIGLVQNFTGAYINPYLQDTGIGGGFDGAVPFIVLILILMIRPHGLFGREHIERV